MCNLYTQTKSVDEVARIFRDLQMPIVFPEGLPNLAPRDIAITDPGVIVRQAQPDGEAYELLVRRWSWPGPGGKPVYNFRSDGREFSSGRCLIVADGFYEFTASSDPKQKRKDRWLFTASDGHMLGIAGLTRTVPEFGEAYTMLTTEPGPDVAPYHSRQIAVIPTEGWRAWLDGCEPAADLLRPLEPGSLSVTLAPREAAGQLL
jgi:putative SOS response-associated peptidase YedK